MDYITEMQKSEDQITAAGDTMSDSEKAALRAGLELKAATMSSVRHSVLGQTNAEGETVEEIVFSERMPLAKIINTKDSTQKVSFSTEKSIGDVQYVVRMKGVDLPVLKTSKGVKNRLGGYTYTFEIETAKIQESRRLSRLRSGGVIEPGTDTVEIVSNAGEFPVILADPVDINGIYEGYVTPDSVLSGIELPIRMGILTNAGKAATFEEIKEDEPYLLLPISKIDIFSPENVPDGVAESWKKVKMTKSQLSNCNCGKPCLVAEFSTNDFAPSGSKLFGADQKVNRNIRIELFDFDAPSLTFTGTIQDGLKGLYRISSVNNDKIVTTWNDTEMAGKLSVRLTNSITDTMTIIEPCPTEQGATPVPGCHEATANEEIRLIADEPAPICNDTHINALMGRIPAGEANCESLVDVDEIAACQLRASCRAATTLDDLNTMSTDDQWECLQMAVDTIINDSNSMSHVLTAVLEADASSVNSNDPIATVCDVQIKNFDDFQTACAKPNCSLCADHPEFVCAADLLARKYLNNLKGTSQDHPDEIDLSAVDLDEQTAIMHSWIEVIRESYLAQQYMAWSADNDIRQKWLTGAVYDGTFVASKMKEFNDGLLTRYRDEVLDVHHGIMGKQFSQTTIEMLAQNILQENAQSIELKSARNAILGELAQTWESVGKALGLSARRYDVLLQDDAKRLSTAKELRPYLFDLYFSGVLESKINIDADVGSLNASYGANLSSIISKIESLDQTFEDLVFMRDGEILKETGFDLGDGKTVLAKRKDAAERYVNSADEERVKVFTAITNKKKEKLSMQDGYLTALESMRTELVNLCGYPSDCDDAEKQQTCKIFTDPYFCGFSLPSTSATGVDITSSDSTTISQVTKYDDCVAQLQNAGGKSEVEIMIACSGGNLSLESNKTSKNAGGTEPSLAGQAIEAYRIAELEYQTALSEYDVLAQKVRNNYATLDAYAANIEKWYESRSGVLENIAANLDKIKSYEEAIGVYNSEVSSLELKEIEDEYKKQADAVKKWKGMAYANMATQETMQALITSASIADLWVSKAADDADSNAQLQALNGIFANTAVTGAGAGTANQVAANTFKGAADALGYASAGLQTAILTAEGTAALADTAFNFEIEKLDRTNDLGLAELQKKLAQDIDNVSVKVEGLDGSYDADGLNDLIADMERTNELLLAEMENEDTYKRDLQDLDFKRNEFKNAALDLLPLAHTVKVKEIAKYRALLEYLTIAQRAGLVASQYDGKLARYQLMQNALFSASDFFQTASDLEMVETFIESARNKLSDYLAAIEYSAVLPFAELRRAIYTARGTNDLIKIYNKLNDLTDYCGNGTDSKNKVIISLREQLGITDAEFDGLTAADRFHLMLAKGNLPVSAQTRYTVTGTVADELKAGTFSSASFAIGSHFANIDQSCNAKIDTIRVRLISKEGKKIRESGNTTPAIAIFYGGQTQLLSCQQNADAVAASIGPRTTYGKFSTFSVDPFADGLNASIYEIPEGEKYVFDDSVELPDVSVYSGLKNYPLMATYSIVFNPAKGENAKINWDNVADIELQINYTTGSLNQNSKDCNYDIL